MVPFSRMEKLCTLKATFVFPSPWNLHIHGDQREKFILSLIQHFWFVSVLKFHARLKKSLLTGLTYHLSLKNELKIKPKFVCSNQHNRLYLHWLLCE